MSSSPSDLVDGAPSRLPFGRLLHVLRTARHMTQIGLGFRAELAQSSISALESGKKQPNAEQVAAIAKALALTSDETRHLYAAASLLPPNDQKADSSLPPLTREAEDILLALLRPSTYQRSATIDIRRRLDSWNLLHQATIAMLSNPALARYILNLIVANEGQNEFQARLANLEDTLDAS